MASRHVLGEAADWIARLMSGSASADDHHAFAAWRMQSPENEAAGAQAIRLWGLAGTALRTGSGAAYTRRSNHVGAGRGDELRSEDWTFLAQQPGRLNIQMSAYL